jgi:hypothetical protein
LWLGFANTFLIGGFVILVIYLTGTVVETMVDEKNLGSRLIGFYPPCLALLLNFSANRMIRSDENLVKSMDRIR